MSRQPIPIDSASSASSTSSVSEPTERFIADVALAIKNAVDPYEASEWAGVSREVFDRWLETHDGLKTAVERAIKHAKVKKAAEAAKRSPEKALRRLRAWEKRAHEPRYSSTPRPYTNGAGHTLVQRATPFLLARIADDTVPVTDLTPIEIAAREMRHDIIADAGGHQVITTTKRHLIDQYIGLWIAASSLDVYIAEMAQSDGLVSRKHRRAFPIIEQRARLADSLLRLATAIGLDKSKPGPSALREYVAANYPGPTEPTSEPEADPVITSEEPA